MIFGAIVDSVVYNHMIARAERNGINREKIKEAEEIAIRWGLISEGVFDIVVVGFIILTVMDII